jgi:hypothetical protein
MRRRTITAVAAALMVGSLATSACAPTQHVSQNQPDTVSYTQDANSAPTVQLLDCWGTTGWHGCGAGWFWRNGWRGMGCYPC